MYHASSLCAARMYQGMRVAVTALQLNRRFIEFESDPTYYYAGKHRFEAALARQMDACEV
jgi:hypothetical protein